MRKLRGALFTEVTSRTLESVTALLHNSSMIFIVGQLLDLLGGQHVAADNFSQQSKQHHGGG